jgi:hypothetical protein
MEALSPSERRGFYKMAKRGFTQQERHQCWYMATGAKQARIPGYYTDLVSECATLLDLNYPSQAYH